MDDTRFEASNVARRLVRSAVTASLGTLQSEGSPFVTLVTVATDIDGAPIVLLSDLAAHSRNLARDDRASLLLQAPVDEVEDPLTAARATVVGRFERVMREEESARRCLARFLARHPEAEGYAGFGDFAVYRMVMDAVHLVAGFGRIARLAAVDVLVPPATADAFMAAEATLVEELKGIRPGLVAVDPDGVDIADGSARRLSFTRRASEPCEVRSLLAELA